MKNKKGFTLVEVLAVIALLGIILLIATPAITRILNGNKKRIMAEDAIRYLEEVENIVESDTSIEYTKYNEEMSTLVFPLENVYSENELKSPFGGIYQGFIFFEYEEISDTKKYTIFLYSNGYFIGDETYAALPVEEIRTSKEDCIKKTDKDFAYEEVSYDTNLPQYKEGEIINDK